MYKDLNSGPVIDDKIVRPTSKMSISLNGHDQRGAHDRGKNKAWYGQNLVPDRFQFTGKRRDTVAW